MSSHDQKDVQTDNLSVKGSNSDSEQGQDHAIPQKRNPFRTVFAQATILGICSFLAPGLWAAMSSTGGGGTQSVSLVNAANSSTFCLMVVTGLLTPTLVRLTNIRIALVIGAVGYAPYAAALYSFRKYGDGASWFVVLGAVICGISAGVFWASEGSIILAYPERVKQGKYLSYWLMFRVLGQFVGGAVNLGLNVDNNQAGSLSTNTYLVFVVLQCLGPFVALTLSLPHQVQRKDGTPVLLNLNPTVKKELKAMWKILTSKKVLLFLPMFWNTPFSEALIGTYAAENFSVRSRALGSLLSAVVAAMSCYILGYLLDIKRWTLNSRARYGFFFVYFTQFAWWGWAIYTMNKYHKLKPTLDFGESEWSRGFAVYIFLQIGFNLMYEFTYWIVGASNDDPGEVVRLASIIRAIESAGQAVSYGINSTGARLDGIAGLNLGQTVLAFAGAWFVVKKVGILKDGTKLYVPPMYADYEQRELLKANLESQGVAPEAVEGATDIKKVVSNDKQIT